MRGLSPVVASGGHSSSIKWGPLSPLWCAGPSPSRPLPLRSTGSSRAGSVVVAHGPSCSAARGIFPDQGSNPCPLHWQVDSQPLRHQGSPCHFIFMVHCYCGSSWSSMSCSSASALEVMDTFLLVSELPLLISESWHFPPPPSLAEVSFRGPVPSLLLLVTLRSLVPSCCQCC